MKFISILYTIFSLFFLIFICIYKKSLEDILINLFVYFFILFIQYRVLMFNHKRLLNYLITYEWLNHIILILGFFFILTIGVRFAYDEQTNTLHRFFSDKNGEVWHWSGSTNQGINSLSSKDIPIDVLRHYGISPKGW